MYYKDSNGNPIIEHFGFNESTTIADQSIPNWLIIIIIILLIIMIICLICFLIKKLQNKESYTSQRFGYKFL
jgi:uncharacterized membrane protein AbrB (regulator of aidB expression)